MNKISEKIYEIVMNGSQKSMHDLAKLLVKCIEHSDKNKQFLCMDLHIIQHGYHFNDDYLQEALSQIGGQRFKKEEVSAKFQAYGLNFDKSVTPCDMSYVIHMFICDYAKINLPESMLYKLAHGYIMDEDYPVVGGKAFAEWRHKQWLCKEIKE